MKQFSRTFSPSSLLMGSKSFLPRATQDVGTRGIYTRSKFIPSFGRSVYVSGVALVSWREFNMASTAANSKTEMKKEPSPNNSDNQKHFWDIIKGFSNVFLLSRAPDGSEHGRPMGLQVKDQAIYFFTEKDSPKVHEIKDDYHITITGQKSDQWVFCKGKAKVITDKAKIAELWTETVRPWFPKDIKDSQVSLICLMPESGEYWDQSSISNKLSFAWDLGKAYVTGQKAQRVGDMNKDGDQHSKVNLAQTAAR